MGVLIYLVCVIGFLVLILCGIAVKNWREDREKRKLTYWLGDVAPWRDYDKYEKK